MPIAGVNPLETIIPVEDAAAFELTPPVFTPQSDDDDGDDEDDCESQDDDEDDEDGEQEQQLTEKERFELEKKLLKQ